MTNEKICRKAKEILISGVVRECENYDFCTEVFRVTPYKEIFSCYGCKLFQQFCEELKNLEGDEK